MSSWLFKLSLYSSVINLAFTPFSSMFARIFGYLTIILFFTSVIQSIFRGWKVSLNKVALSFLVLVIVAFVMSLNSMTIKSVGDIIDNLLSIISFVIFYIALSTEQPNQKVFTLEDVFRAKNILCAILIVFAFGPFGFKYEVINEYGGTIFTLGLGNPNGVALYVMFAIILSMIQFYNTTKKATKVINIVIIAMMFYILYLLSSRTVLLCSLIVAMAFLLRLPKVFKWISYFAVITPIFTMVLQLQLANMDNIALQILGKSINTGRPDLYIEVLSELMTSPIKLLFGDLCTYHFYNSHNGVLTILATLGLGGVLLYIIFWNQQLSKLRNISMDKSQKLAFIALMVVLIHASSESMSVVGTIPFCIFVVVIMKIAKGEIKSKYDRFTADRI